MTKKSMYYSILTIAFLGLIVLAAGFSKALSVTTTTPQPAANAPGPQVKGESAKQSSLNPNSLPMLILGDSIAKGTGDEKGKGFTGYLTDSFKSDTPKEIRVTNAGIDGLESSGLLDQLQSQKLTKPIADSDLILISIGGNDLKSILTLNTLAQEDAFKTRQDNYLKNLKQTLKVLRTINPHATIIFLGLYNPYAKITAAEETALLNEWNFNSQQLIEGDGKAIFIPTYDLLKYNLDRYIAQDDLHPNSAGYQAISARISKSLEPIIRGL